ncbi:MAG: RNA-binding protein [Thermoprotei archaeon]|nr:MAG: RNA-binding protein [Thermoprotei archaeon]
MKRDNLVVVRIGKKGITEGIISEIDNVLEKRGMVKIKLLRNFREAYGISRNDVAIMLSERLNACIEDVRGFTIILRRQKFKK